MSEHATPLDTAATDPSARTASATTPGLLPAQVFHVTVSDGYRPSVLQARSGVPVRIVFDRRDERACSDRVVFSRPYLERHLAPRSLTIVDLPAMTGEVRFTCGMGRYRGRIELSGRAASSWGRSWIAVGAVLIVAVALVSLLALASASGSTASVVFAAVLLLADVAALAALIRHGDRYTVRWR